jgi:glucose-1-phosphate adenylyltransferase
VSTLADTLTVVLAGERGTALGSLTRDRAKAAVPFGGEYRIVDFVLSNCLHSGLRRVYVLTQYHAHSLHEHLRAAWGVFNPELDEFITAVPPQVRDGSRWYEGSAQALAENLFLIRRSGARHVLVLAGGHVYRMDYAALLDTHRARKARVTVAWMAMPSTRAQGLDRLSCDAAQRVTGYVPAPDGPAVVDASEPGEVAASIGAMVVDTELLESVLADGQEVGGDGLAAHLLPRLLEGGRVYGYRFGGRKGRVSPDRFFSPVSGVDAYFEANMALLEPVPPLDLYQSDWPIWSHSRRLPPARTVASRKGNEGLFVNSIVSNGTVITGGAVTHSVLCPRVRVSDSASVERCILFDDVEVGEGVQLRNCVIDKYARIPAGTRIGFDAREDAARFEVTPRGVVVVPKGYPDRQPGRSAVPDTPRAIRR